MNRLIEEKFCEGFEDQGAQLVILRNQNGTKARFTNYGARWVGMAVPEASGQQIECVLGFDSLRAYLQAGERYHGAIVGRVCGRIGGASFRLKGCDYPLASNDAYGTPVKNQLHGGVYAFDNQFWETKRYHTPDGDEAVVFSLFSPDGDEGYPGNLRVTVSYVLCSQSDTLVMECRAACDRASVVNLTNHAFFNLAGHTSRMSVSEQRLTLAADRMVICDNELIPTGELLPVAGTYADFTQGRTLAESIALGGDQVRRDGGFTLAYALTQAQTMPRTCRFAARLEDPVSRRSMELFTDQPSLQIYNGYFMDGTDLGHEAMPYFANAGLAIEPQGFPDAPNRPEFPSIAIDAEHPYRQRTKYVFSRGRIE